MDYMLKIKKPTDRRHRHLTFYRSKYFKMPLFLSNNSSKDLVPNQGSVEILDIDRGHIMLSCWQDFVIPMSIFKCHYLSPANALVFNSLVTSIDPDRGQVCQIAPNWSQNLLKSHNCRFRALKKSER